MATALLPVGRFNLQNDISILRTVKMKQRLKQYAIIAAAGALLWFVMDNHFVPNLSIGEYSLPTMLAGGKTYFLQYLTIGLHLSVALSIVPCRLGSHERAHLSF